MAVQQVVVAAGRSTGAICTSTRQDLVFGNTRSLLAFPRLPHGSSVSSTRTVVVRLSKEHLGAQEFGKLWGIRYAHEFGTVLSIGRNDIWQSPEFKISSLGRSVGCGTQKLCTCILWGERELGVTFRNFSLLLFRLLCLAVEVEEI